MDTARRWQVASLTAAAGCLGVGALLLGQPVSDPADPIEFEILDARVAATSDGLDAAPPRIAGPGDAGAERPGPEIIGPGITVVGDTPDTVLSIASPVEATTREPAVSNLESLDGDSVSSASSIDSDA